MGNADWYERHSMEGKLAPVVEELSPRLDGQTGGVLTFMATIWYFDSLGRVRR